LIIRLVRKVFRKSDIYLDSGANIYIYSKRQRFISYRIYSYPVNKIDNIIIIAKRKDSIIIITNNNKEVELINIYYISKNQYNIILIAKLAKKGYTISFRGKFFDIKNKTGKTLFLS